MESGREKRAEEITETITEEITAGGHTYLLLMDWTAEFCVLFPFILSGLSPENIVRSIVAGAVLWCVVTGLVQRWIEPGRDFLQSVETRAGRKAALAVCAVGLWYFLARTAVFAKLWASLFRMYLTPGIPAAILCAVPLAAGLALNGRGLRIRARVGRYTGIARLAGCVCAAAAGAFCVAAELLLTPRERWLADFPAVEAMRRLRPFGVDIGRCEMVLVFLLLAGLTMTVAGGIRYVQRFWEYVYAACAEFWRGELLPGIRERMAERQGRQEGPQEGQELYGTEFSGELSAFPGQGRIRYYGVRMTRKLSGSPFAGKISCYGEKIVENLTAHRLWWWVVVLVVYMLAAGFADAFSAMAFYCAYNLQILVPVMIGLCFAIKVFVSRKKML